MTPENWNISKIVQAVIDDDPDAVQIQDSLKQSLNELRQGKFARCTSVEALSTVQTRQKTGLSQEKFAAALGISSSTLKSWEQGTRKPSGAAGALLKLLDKHPNLISELG